MFFMASMTTAFSRFFSAVTLMPVFFTNLMFLSVHQLPFAVALFAPAIGQCLVALDELY